MDRGPKCYNCHGWGHLAGACPTPRVKPGGDAGKKKAELISPSPCDNSDRMFDREEFKAVEKLAGCPFTLDAAALHLSSLGAFQQHISVSH